ASASDNCKLYINHCDLINRSEVSSRALVNIGNGTGREVTILNSNLVGYHETVRGIVLPASGENIVQYGWNNIFTVGPQYVNLDPADTDVNPPLDPKYLDL